MMSSSERYRKAALFQNGAALCLLKTIDTIRRMNQVEDERSRFQEDDLAAAQNRNCQHSIQFEPKRSQRAQNPFGVFVAPRKKNIYVLVVSG